MEDNIPPVPIGYKEYLEQHSVEELAILKDSVRTILLEVGEVTSFKIEVARSIRKLEGRARTFGQRKTNTDRVRIAMNLIDTLAEEIMEESLPLSLKTENTQT